MQTEELIPATEFCVYHNIDYSFISSLKESGLIEITTIEEQTYLPVSQLTDLERFVRLHYEMDVNLEGIETINYLLVRLNEMQHQITLLSNRLRVYENE